MSDGLRELQERLRNAHAELTGLAEATGSRSNARRLGYKSQGVSLALGYIDEMLRAVPVSASSDSLGTSLDAERGEGCYICQPENPDASDEGCEACEKRFVDEVVAVPPNAPSRDALKDIERAAEDFIAWEWANCGVLVTAENEERYLHRDDLRASMHRAARASVALPEPSQPTDAQIAAATRGVYATRYYADEVPWDEAHSSVRRECEDIAIAALVAARGVSVEEDDKQ